MHRLGCKIIMSLVFLRPTKKERTLAQENIPSFKYHENGGYYLAFTGVNFAYFSCER